MLHPILKLTFVLVTILPSVYACARYTAIRKLAQVCVAISELLIASAMPPITYPVTFIPSLVWLLVVANSLAFSLVMLIDLANIEAIFILLHYEIFT